MRPTWNKRPLLLTLWQSAAYVREMFVEYYMYSWTSPLRIPRRLSFFTETNEINPLKISQLLSECQVKLKQLSTTLLNYCFILVFPIKQLTFLTTCSYLKVKCYDIDWYGGGPCVILKSPSQKSLREEKSWYPEDLPKNNPKNSVKNI